MGKKLDNIIIFKVGEIKKFIPVVGGGSEDYLVKRDRKAHGKKMQMQYEKAWEQANTRRYLELDNPIMNENGVYLNIKGKPDCPLTVRSLENLTQNIRLANTKIEDNNVVSATFFIPEKKQSFYIKKMNKYLESDKGTEIVAEMENIQAARIENFWIGTDKEFLSNNKKMWCEVWLRLKKKDKTESIISKFKDLCVKLKIKIKDQHIIFPERLIMGVYANKEQLELIIKYSSFVAEFRKMSMPTDLFISMSKEYQREYSKDLKERIDIKKATNTSVCLLDTGVNNGHPLLEEILIDKNTHSLSLSNSLEDIGNHGTKMAGIASFFTLEDKLESTNNIEVAHFLESVKILDKGNDNDPELYGNITANAVSIAEIENPKINRVVCMAVTAQSNIENDGRPSSWSGALDSIISGSEEDNVKRIMCISAGNTTVQEINEAQDYKTAIANHSVEDPGQSWNVLTVGAFTEKDILDNIDYKGYEPLVKAGGVSPFTSSSITWDDIWPIKPEIVFEGGNLAYNKDGNFYIEADELSLLTTGNKYFEDPFDSISMTSSATAQASYTAAEILAKYPKLWPETVRALMVHSANWTPEMIKSVNVNENKNLSRKECRELLRTCGYGVPSLERALWSASNSVNLIIEDELQPFIKKKSGITFNEMKIHTLPWPKELLLDAENINARMRITLSYYIEPGPGERGWKDKYKYPSCRLAFDVNNSFEDKSNFLKRISKSARENEDDKNEVKNDSSRWKIGITNRNVGSIHSDIWEGSCSQLSESNLIMVYPQSGWWKTRTNLKKYNSKIRYSLVVSIETPENEIDLYNSIKTKIEISNKVKVKTENTKIEIPAF